MSGGGFPGRIAIARADSYEADGISAAVKTVLNPFGGAVGILGDKKKVLLKPNVLRPALPEEAVTTHPAVVKAVAREFMEAGAEVSVGDSPGGDPGPAGPAFVKCGIEGVCRELGIPLLNFQKEGVVEVDLLNSPAGRINIAKPVAEADIVVNIPKFKTHTLTQLTCAIKNPYGFIPGFLKARLHLKAPMVKDFARILCAIWKLFPPDFTLVDAVVGMEGPGPSSGDPVKAGWLLGGTDPVALDTVVAHAMGFSPGEIIVTEEAVRSGLGTGDLNRIEIINGSLEDLRIPGFRLPHVSLLARWLPRWITISLSFVFERIFWVRPHVNPEKCEICHRCVRSCPVSAMRAEKGEVPRLADPRACISCLCCQEICPAKAVEVRKSFVLTRFLSSEERRIKNDGENG